MNQQQGNKAAAAAAAKSTPEGRQAWETRRQQQPRAPQNEDHEAWRETIFGDKAAAAAKSRTEWRSRRETRRQRHKLGRQGGSSSQDKPRMEIRKGDKGRQGGSGTTTISGFWRSATQSKNPYSFQLSGEWRQEQPRAGQNGNHEGRQMKGDKAAGAAKSRPEWRHMKGD